jgi:hypothetical protein
MEKELFIDIMKEEKKGKRNVIIVTEGIAGHGGYSSSSIAFEVNASQVVTTEKCIKINGLHKVVSKSYSYGATEDVSQANPNLESGKYIQVIIEYSRVIYVGVE